MIIHRVYHHSGAKDIYSEVNPTSFLQGIILEFRRYVALLRDPSAPGHNDASSAFKYIFDEGTNARVASSPYPAAKSP